MHSRTWPVLLCRRLCTVTQGLVGPLHRVRCTICSLCAEPHCLVLCPALHCVCLAALHLWAVGSGQWNFCNAPPHCLGAVGC